MPLSCIVVGSVQWLELVIITMSTMELSSVSEDELLLSTRVIVQFGLGSVVMQCIIGGAVHYTR